MLDAGETELFGCVYIDPADAGSPPGTEAVVSWWVVDKAAGTDLERALADVVPRWLRGDVGLPLGRLHTVTQARVTDGCEPGCDRRECDRGDEDPDRGDADVGA